MSLDKYASYLFHLNRNNYNTADRKIMKVLMEVFEKGKKAGKKEQAKLIMIMAKRLSKP